MNLKISTKQQLNCHNGVTIPEIFEECLFNVKVTSCDQIRCIENCMISFVHRCNKLSDTFSILIVIWLWKSSVLYAPPCTVIVRQDSDKSNRDDGISCITLLRSLTWKTTDSAKKVIADLKKLRDSNFKNNCEEWW